MAVLLMLGVLWLQRKMLRRLQFCILFSLLIHICAVVYMHETYLAVGGPRTTPIEQAGEPDMRFVVPENDWQQVEQAEPPQSFENPVETPSPQQQETAAETIRATGPEPRAGGYGEAETGPGRALAAARGGRASSRRAAGVGPSGPNGRRAASPAVAEDRPRGPTSRSLRLKSSPPGSLPPRPPRPQPRQSNGRRTSAGGPTASDRAACLARKTGTIAVGQASIPRAAAERHAHRADPGAAAGSARRSAARGRRREPIRPAQAAELSDQRNGAGAPSQKHRPHRWPLDNRRRNECSPAGLATLGLPSCRRIGRFLAEGSRHGKRRAEPVGPACPAGIRGDASLVQRRGSGNGRDPGAGARRRRRGRRHETNSNSPP